MSKDLHDGLLLYKSTMYLLEIVRFISPVRAFALKSRSY
jgi:hypothetical protein